MIRTLWTSIKLSQTYGINTVIYWLRQLPLIKHLFPAKIYGDSGLKMVIRIYINLYRIIKALLGKAFYTGVMIYLPLFLLNRQEPGAFLNIIFWLSLAGAAGNTYLFNPTKEKYYMLILMRMDGRRFVRSNYLWFLIQNSLSFLPAILIFGLLLAVPLPVLLIIPLFIAAIKVLGAFCLVKYYERTGRTISENNWKILLPVVGIGLLAGYIPVIMNIAVPVICYIIVMLLAGVLAVYPVVYLWQCRTYGRLYKEMLDLNVIMFSAQATTRITQQKALLNNIDDSEAYTGDKRGYEYFNAIFVERHRKLLTRPVKYQSVICLLIIVVISGICLWNRGALEAVGQKGMMMLPYMVFVMYLLNRSNTMTQAMFMNCDHSMLAYRFYRQKQTILGLFKIRLRTLVKLNLIPAVIIGCGFAFVVFITGGSEHPSAYVLIILSILSLSVFFSVHHLTLYYLLQPYNVNIEAKSKAYSIANWLTYFVCYMFIQLKAPLFLFSILSIVFSVAYICAALMLVYRYAPKWFRLK